MRERASGRSAEQWIIHIFTGGCSGQGVGKAVRMDIVGSASSLKLDLQRKLPLCGTLQTVQRFDFCGTELPCLPDIGTIQSLSLSMKKRTFVHKLTIARCTAGSVQTCVTTCVFDTWTGPKLRQNKALSGHCVACTSPSTEQQHMCEVEVEFATSITQKRASLQGVDTLTLDLHESGKHLKTLQLRRVDARIRHIAANVKSCPLWSFVVYLELGTVPDVVTICVPAQPRARCGARPVEWHLDYVVLRDTQIGEDWHFPFHTSLKTDLAVSASKVAVDKGLALDFTEHTPVLNQIPEVELHIFDPE